MDYRILIWKNNLDDSEVAKWRSKGIGGTDVSTLFGVNPSKSRRRLIEEKTGHTQLVIHEKMKFRMRVKDFIAEEFKKTGIKLLRKNAILQNVKHPFMIANVDRMIAGKKEGLLCKATSNKDFTLQRNERSSIYLQCQHYMAVTNAKGWWVAMLVGGIHLHYYYIDRDENLITKIINTEKEFWYNEVLR
ncbi:YqaJ viral recombinase family protein [Fictibacillus sp. KIGAM418]|uniref:YqaJ viral recombinase family protein n=1 Tax=Fictibacillus marinisediminis TaxID=2878389 RepID=A0A9X1XGV0_9BACL|nr:YqaJ viral recombinase family protein [Fictibacillus marinisediminis]MCK6259433.1 YqaJ viral recombinase family protein [Fictibacillus marinisediminis]